MLVRVEIESKHFVIKSRRQKRESGEGQGQKVDQGIANQKKIDSQHDRWRNKRAGADKCVKILQKKEK